MIQARQSAAFIIIKKMQCAGWDTKQCKRWCGTWTVHER